MKTLVREISQCILGLRDIYYIDFKTFPNYVILSPTMITLIETEFHFYTTRYTALNDSLNNSTLYGMKIIPSPRVKSITDIEVY